MLQQKHELKHNMGLIIVFVIKLSQLDTHEAIIEILSDPSHAIQFNWNIIISNVKMDAINSNNDSFAIMINSWFDMSHSRILEAKVKFCDSICSQGSESIYLHKMSKEKKQETGELFKSV